MSKLRSLFGRKMWLGLLLVFFVSLVVDAICSLLFVKGVLPDTSVNTCVYVSWGIGALTGACVAVKGEDGVLLRGIVLSVICFCLTWLLGFLLFDTMNFGGYGLGVALAIFGGCMLGSVFGRGKKKKRRYATGKKGNKNRHKK